jgi:hypothetical protein
MGKGGWVAGMAYALLNVSVGVRALPVRDNTHRVAGSAYKPVPQLVRSTKGGAKMAGGAEVF